MASSTHKQNLIDTLRKAAKSPALFSAVLEDLFTPAEFEDFVKRWRIVQLLHQGVSQREIARELKTSLVKITRGSSMLRNPRGGFNQLLS